MVRVPKGRQSQLSDTVAARFGSNALTIQEQPRPELCPILQFESDALVAAGHALRGSISTMIVLGQALLDESNGHIDETQRSVISAILSSGAEALALMDGFFGEASIRAGLTTTFRKPVSLVDVIKGIIAIHQKALEQNKLTIELQVSRSSAVEVPDEDGLVRAFEKLLLYSIKSAKSGSTIRIRVSSSIRFARVVIQLQGGDRNGVQPKCGEGTSDVAIASRIFAEHGGQLEKREKPGGKAEWVLLFPRNREAKG